MPNASKETASESVALEGYEGHFEHFEGGYSVGFETYTADADLAPLFRGSPTAAASARTGDTSSRGRSSSRSATGTKRPTRPETPTTRLPGIFRTSTPGPRWSSSIRPPSSRRRWRSSSGTWHPRAEETGKAIGPSVRWPSVRPTPRRSPARACPVPSGRRTGRQRTRAARTPARWPSCRSSG